MPPRAVPAVRRVQLARSSGAGDHRRILIGQRSVFDCSHAGATARSVSAATRRPSAISGCKRVLARGVDLTCSMSPPRSAGRSAGRRPRWTTIVVESLPDDRRGIQKLAAAPDLARDGRLQRGRHTHRRHHHPTGAGFSSGCRARPDRAHHLRRKRVVAARVAMRLRRPTRRCPAAARSALCAHPTAAAAMVWAPDTGQQLLRRW